ncbi:DNA-binding transcriptional ArsR family regulator [Bacillus sp. RC54]
MHTEIIFFRLPNFFKNVLYKGYRSRAPYSYSRGLTIPSSLKITKTYLQIYKSRYNILMEPLLIYKALSNETRCQILSWLKNPENHFDEKPYLEQDLNFQVGVCVGDIQLKTGLAQSVISSYLLTMKKAGLLESDRIGKWTYYRRNEKTIREFSEYVQNEL